MKAEQGRKNLRPLATNQPDLRHPDTPFQPPHAPTPLSPRLINAPFQSTID
jgi:hypothetical protein